MDDNVSAAGVRAHSLGGAVPPTQDGGRNEPLEITEALESDGASLGGFAADDGIVVGDETRTDGTPLTMPIDEQQLGVDIADAAKILGLPVPTLRKRLQRGTQNGFKSDDGTWRVLLENNDSHSIDQQARRAVSRSMSDAANRLSGWTRAPLEVEPEAQDGHPGNQNAGLAALAAEIGELREEIERNSALLESTQWQIAQINPPGQFQHLQNHTETMIENQLRPVVSALMAVLDYLDREREETRKAQRPLAAKK